MICPHCKKSIDRKVSDEALKRAQWLKKSGFSLRDIERILFKEGHQVSASTLCRRLKKDAK